MYIIPLSLKIFKLKQIVEKLRMFVKSNPFQFLLSVFIALGFLNIYFIFKYTKSIEDSKCNCENKQEEILRKLLNYYSISIIVIYIITTILCLVIKLKTKN